MCQPGVNEDLMKYPLSSIVTYCQNDTNKIAAKQSFTYNESNQIKKISFFIENKEFQHVVFNYNEEGLLILKDFFKSHKEIELSKTRRFEYNEKNELVLEIEEDKNGSFSKISYQYNTIGLLIKKVIKTKYDNSEYTYTYNSNRLLVKILKNNILETSFEYSNNLLMKETDVIRGIIKTFEYGDRGNLLLVKEEDQIVKRNMYSNYRLIKSWSYYYGIDPCYDKCCGRRLMKYEYYE